jgi:hypothetical protein
MAHEFVANFVEHLAGAAFQVSIEPRPVGKLDPRSLGDSFDIKGDIAAFLTQLVHGGFEPLAHFRIP